jgi:hypothetical protein
VCEYPLVNVLGHRQSDKTTFVRMAILDYDYVALEDPENRLIATQAAGFGWRSALVPIGLHQPTRGFAKLALT